MRELIKGKRGPRKGTRYAHHKYLYIDEKGHYVYEEEMAHRRGKRGRPSKEEIRKLEKPKERFIASDDLILQQTGKTSNQIIIGNIGIGLRLASNFADNYGILKFTNHTVMDKIESFDGGKVTTVLPIGIYGEIFQEAIIGMWNGLRLWAERTAEGKKVKISKTTAMYQGAENNLKQTMLPIIKGQVARIPPHILRKINTLADAEMDLTMELGRLPTSKELAIKTGFNEASIISIRKIRNLMYKKSLSEQVKRSDGKSRQRFEDIIKAPDDVENKYIERVTEREQDKTIKKVLKALEPWEREIIVRRFGIGIEKKLIPAEYEEFVKEEPVKIVKLFRKKEKSSFVKQYEKITGQKAEVKVQTFARVKNLATGGIRDVSTKSLRNIKTKKGKKTAILVTRVLRKTKDAEETLVPRHPETWDEIASNVKVPVMRKVVSRTSGEKPRDMRNVAWQTIVGDYFPRIVRKLRASKELKKVWANMEVKSFNFIKSLTAELLKARHNLA